MNNAQNQNSEREARPVKSAYRLKPDVITCENSFAADPRHYVGMHSLEAAAQIFICQSVDLGLPDRRHFHDVVAIVSRQKPPGRWRNSASRPLNWMCAVTPLSLVLTTKVPFRPASGRRLGGAAVVQPKRFATRGRPCRFQSSPQTAKKPTGEKRRRISSPPAASSALLVALGHRVRPLRAGPAFWAERLGTVSTKAHIVRRRLDDA